jgi:hypothetical protein
MSEIMDNQHPPLRSARATALLKRLQGAYRPLLVVLGGLVAYAVATPAYAATTNGHSDHIYTIGRQSTLTGAIIILVIAIVSIRRNLKRSVGPSALVEMSPLSRPGTLDRPRSAP